MKKSLLVCLAIAGTAFANACNENTIDFGCSKDDNYCAKEDNKDVCYICTQIKDGSFWSKEVCEFGGVNKSVDANGNETAEPVDSIEKANACRTINCVNGVDDTGKCKCPESCANGCEDNGACKRIIDCKNGYKDDGSCINPDFCKLGWEDDGTCKKAGECKDNEGNLSDARNVDGTCAGCKNGWKEDGSCLCPESCAKGCKNDGSCEDKVCTDDSCVECVYGIGKDGSCIKPEFCKLGWEDDGTCKKADECKDNDANSVEERNVDGTCVGCKNGWNDDGTCLCPESCAKGCKNDGSCEDKVCTDDACVECVYGVGKDGTCIKPDFCKLGWEDGGTCKKADECKNNDGHLVDERNADGTCVGCKNGWNDDGSCACSSLCANECNPDGSCKLYLNCANGWNQDGSCACSVVCFLGCEKDGSCKESEKCSCADEKYCEKDDEGKCKPCHDAWNTDGSCKECKNGWNKDGSCLCPNNCAAGCFENGICKQLGACVGLNDVAVCNQYDYCKDNLCRCNASNNCELRDTNHNNMDDLSERLEINESECEHNKVNCESKYGKGTFCDSFIGYRCSTKCTDDNQCLEGFICRGDGRCAANSFTTIWDKELRGHTLELVSESKSCDVYVCWDWQESDKMINNYSDLKQPDENAYNKYPEFKTATCPVEFEHFDDCTTMRHDYSDSNHDGLKYHRSGADSENITVKIYGELDKVRVGKFSQKRSCYDDKKDYINCKHRDDEYHLDVCECYADGDDNGELKSCPEKCYTACLNDNDENCNNDCINCRLNCNSSNDYCSKVLFYDGSCRSCIFDPGFSKSNLLEVSSFGRAGVGKRTFENCYQFSTIQLTDIPDATKLLSMEGMFLGACSFNSPIQNWDVSNVTSMPKVFDMPVCQPGNNGGEYVLPIYPVFNQPLNKWDVSKVEDMSDMFGYLPSFNQPLNDWDVSSVTNMEAMFGSYGSSILFNSFNQPLDGWNVSNVDNMKRMFLNAKYFKQNISNWKLKENVETDKMFQGALMEKTCEYYPENVSDCN